MTHREMSIKGGKANKGTKAAKRRAIQASIGALQARLAAMNAKASNKAKARAAKL